MPTKWFEGEVSKIVDVTSTVRRFFLKVKETTSFDFKPGQFVTVDLPISEKRLGRWRSYSIANAPDNSNTIELCIVKLEGGSGTDYLFNEVKLGSLLRFKGPDGMFVLPSDLDQELVLLCTGTGVAPFRSMIQHVHQQGLDYRSIHLIYGTRYSEGILYRDEFLKLAEEESRFEYSVALSRDRPDEKLDWQQSGYIHPIYLERYAKVNPNRIFLICGWSKMIDEAVANLIIKLGYDKTQVKYELYG